MIREPVEILELRQKVCGLRFSVGACPATIGGSVVTECLNTFQTCPVRAAYDASGMIRWRFVRPSAPVPRLADESDPLDIATNARPWLRSLTFDTRTMMNPGGQLQGVSPLGVIGGFTADLADETVTNDVGDFYGRGVKGLFWPIFKARIGEAVAQLEAVIYRGFKGQTLAEMQSLRYDVTSIDIGVNGARVTGVDPMARTASEKAQFPRASNLSLGADIDATTTQITVTGPESDLTAQFGNVTDARMVRVGSEFIRFTGYTGAAGVWQLVGVTRAAAGTVAAAHRLRDQCQRVGWYRDILLYRVAQDLLENHAGLAGVPDNAQWTSEGGTWLSTLRVREAFVGSPEPVRDLVAETMRDGLFSLWWDAFAASIPLYAIKPPPPTVPVLSDRANLTGDGVTTRSDPKARLTRVTIYYNIADWSKKLDERTNYRNVRVKGDLELEDPNYADGTVRERQIYSRWISTEAQALLVQSAMLKRFSVTPEETTVRVDYKDAGQGVGDIVAVDTFSQLGPLGERRVRKWQVIETDEVEVGHLIELGLQSVDAYDGRYGYIMANDAPNYAGASDAQRLLGCFLADETTGLMPDGSPPYLIQ